MEFTWIMLPSDFNPLYAIAPKVISPRRDDKCSFWNHFDTASLHACTFIF